MNKNNQKDNVNKISFLINKLQKSTAFILLILFIISFFILESQNFYRLLFGFSIFKLLISIYKKKFTNIFIEFILVILAIIIRIPELFVDSNLLVILIVSIIVFIFKLISVILSFINYIIISTNNENFVFFTSSNKNKNGGFTKNNFRKTYKDFIYSFSKDEKIKSKKNNQQSSDLNSGVIDVDFKEK